jgi:plasmid stabilization system protein ParE
MRQRAQAWVCGRWAGEEVIGTRVLPSRPHVIVYRLKDEDVAEILYIWHGAQNWR